VLVSQRKEIRGDGALIRLFETRETERSGDKETRGYVGRRGRLMWMERPSVISWGTEFVSEDELASARAKS
jgi:hypothetical protein